VEAASAAVVAVVSPVAAQVEAGRRT